jgi:hypothetical protein
MIKTRRFLEQALFSMLVKKPAAGNIFVLQSICPAKKGKVKLRKAYKNHSTAWAPNRLNSRACEDEI